MHIYNEMKKKQKTLQHRFYRCYLTDPELLFVILHMTEDLANGIFKKKKLPIVRSVFTRTQKRTPLASQMQTGRLDLAEGVPMAFTLL